MDGVPCLEYRYLLDVKLGPRKDLKQNQNYRFAEVQRYANYAHRWATLPVYTAT